MATAPGAVKRILCPVDFSEPARVALRWAVELGRRFDAEITLFHVYMAPAYSMPDGLIVGGAELVADVLKEIERTLASWREEAVALGAPEPKTAAEMGTSHPAITRYAKENAFDLIVMGTHGRTGLTHVLLGSTAEKVVRHAHCPVLTVRASDDSP